MTTADRLITLQNRMSDEQRRLILIAADTDMLPTAGMLAHISSLERAQDAVIAAVEDQAPIKSAPVANPPDPKPSSVVIGVEKTTMITGTVKWFNATKGFGFIQPHNAGPDAFVHISTVERSGLNELHEGQKVSYELAADRKTGRQSADNLKVLK